MDVILQEKAKQQETLRQFLRRQWRFSSRLIKELGREKKVFVEGKRRRMNYLLSPGVTVSVDLGWEKNTYAPYPREIDVLYEDEAMMVLNKDPLFSVHPVGGYQTDTVLNAIAHYQLNNESDFKIRFAHRLDRDTSGALIVAKNKWIHEELSRQFREESVQKVYLALCHGSFQGSFSVEGKIGLAEDGIHREFREDGKDSRTDFTALKTRPEVTLVEARPLTGRTHQIRVHLASKGYPIVGDTLYGVQNRANRQMLHCHRLELLHPLTREPFTVTAPLKEDFLQEMEKFKI